MNPQSTIEFHVDDRNIFDITCLSRVYRSSIGHVCPVIPVDAAHLQSCYKGMIFIYSGLTGNDEACILGLYTWNT